MRSILDFAAQHMPVAEKNHNSCKGEHHVRTKRRRGAIAVKTQTSCEHSCPEHKEVMSPALWGALPKDLLHMIFRSSSSSRDHPAKVSVEGLEDESRNSTLRVQSGIILLKHSCAIWSIVSIEPDRGEVVI